MTTQRLTPNKASVLAHKLEDWVEGLPSDERAFVDEVLARAASTAQPEVRGYFTLIEMPIDPYEEMLRQIAEASYQCGGSAG